MVILYVRYLRYKGWEIWQLTDAYGEGWVIWQRPDRRDGMQRRKIKGSDPSSPGAVHLAALESNILEKYPRLLEHMAVTRLEDGSARSPGTVLWKTLGSSWVIVLKEPDEALQLQVVGPSFDDALALAELMLTSSEAPWEADTWQKARNAKSKK